MDDDPKNELPPLELGLWLAGGIFLLMGALALLYAARLDAADTRARRMAGNDRPARNGRNRKGAIALLAAGSVAVIAALVVTVTT